MKLYAWTTLTLAAFIAKSTAQDDGASTNSSSETTGSLAPAPSPTCTSSDQCGEGLFCSSLTATCEMLTCQNWVAGVPTGDTAYSEEPCSAETQGDTGDYFCGWDGSCYTYNCQDWYTYGPVEFTHYDPGNPVELECSDYDKGEEENLNSIVFGCRPYQPGSKAPESLNWVFYFNQECKATPRGSDEFKCYQNKENTDYNDYLGEVSRLNPPSCDRDTYGGLTEQNLYWYQIVVRQLRKGAVTNYKQGRDNTANSLSFDPSEADKTMFAMLETEDDIPPPNTAPPATTAPVDSSALMVAFPSFLCSLWSVVAAVVFFL